MGKNSLPPGFRFHPTDIELVKYYLKRKISGKKLAFDAIAEVDIYKYAPWDLPDMSCSKTGDLKWFFFCPIEKKYARGGRLNRATVYGYWKTTGKDRSVKYNEQVVGMIKTLVFHQGKAPHGKRTDWVMHEYRLEDKDLADGGVVQDSYVLCVLFKKEGIGPRNGAQYGAPFKEEDWSDNEDEMLTGTGTGSVSCMSTLALAGAGGSCVSQMLSAGPSVESSGLNSPLLVHANLTVKVNTDIDSNANTNAALTPVDSARVPEPVPSLMEAPQLALVPQVQESNDNILSLLDIFTEEEPYFNNDRGQMTGNANDSLLDEAPQLSDNDDILTLLASFGAENNSNNLLHYF